MIGLTLISLANVLTTSFKAQAEKVVKEVVLADYQVSAAQIFASPGIPTGLSQELLELEEVTELSRTRATVVGYNNRPLILGAVDREVFDLIKTEYAEHLIEKFGTRVEEVFYDHQRLRHKGESLSLIHI